MTELNAFIKQGIKALETETPFFFRQSYKEITLQAALNSDKQLALLAMTFYSLNKLLSKSYVKNSKPWFKTKKDLLILFDKSLLALKQNKQEVFSGLLDMIAQEIFLLDKNLGHFEVNIIDKSRLKIASAIYGFGYSLGLSASLTNADKKSLLEYLGMSIANSGLIPVLSIDDRISLMAVLRLTKMQIVFDASSLIVLTENCFSFLFDNLSSSLKKTQLTLPVRVFEEAVSTPIQIKKFELNALRINELISSGTLVVVKSTVESKTLSQKIAFLANNLFFIDERPLELMHLGECEALAISILNNGILCIEERTTRALIEQPLDLQAFLEQRQSVKLFVNKKNLEEFQRLTSTIKIIRSADLLAFAFKKKIVAFKPDFLEASLFAMKYHGCSIGSDEILEFLKIKQEIKK